MLYLLEPMENFSDNLGIIGRQLLGLEAAVKGDTNRFPNLKTVTVLASSRIPDDHHERNIAPSHTYNPVGDLTDDSGLDQDGELKDEEFVRLETVASLWARRHPGFEVVFDTSRA